MSRPGRPPIFYHLTKKMIDEISFAAEGEQVFYKDEEMAGFGLRVGHRKKSFILEKRINGKMKRLTIGEFGPMTLDRARKKALEILGGLAIGKDIDEIYNPRGPTLGQLWEAYEERHLPRKKPSSSKRDKGSFKNHLTMWKERRLNTIKRKDVALLHSEIGQTVGHIAANRTLALLRKMFNLAKLWGFYDGENPATLIEQFPEYSRERFLQPGELPKFMKALKAEANPYVRAAIFTMLLTGQRKGEVLTMKWEDLDVGQGVWHIPDTKPGRSHHVPLPGAIIDLLNTLPIHHNNPYVFVGHKRHSHLVSIGKNFNAIKRRAGLADIRPHDLRRTVGSWMAGAGESLPIIGKALGHTQSSSTMVYARLQLDPVRAALEATAQKMLLIAGEKKENPGRNEAED